MPTLWKFTISFDRHHGNDKFCFYFVRRCFGTSEKIRQPEKKKSVALLWITMHMYLDTRYVRKMQPWLWKASSCPSQGLIDEMIERRSGGVLNIWDLLLAQYSSFASPSKDILWWCSWSWDFHIKFLHALPITCMLIFVCHKQQFQSIVLMKSKMRLH